MGKGYGSAPLALSLVRAQVQRVLVEAGSSVIVLDGGVTLRYPFAWLAERVIASHLPLAAEQVFRLEEGAGSNWWRPAQARSWSCRPIRLPSGGVCCMGSGR